MTRAYLDARNILKQRVRTIHKNGQMNFKNEIKSTEALQLIQKISQEKKNKQTKSNLTNIRHGAQRRASVKTDSIVEIWQQRTTLHYHNIFPKRFVKFSVSSWQSNVQRRTEWKSLPCVCVFKIEKSKKKVQIGREHKQNKNLFEMKK